MIFYLRLPELLLPPLLEEEDLPLLLLPIELDELLLGLLNEDVDLRVELLVVVERFIVLREGVDCIPLLLEDDEDLLLFIALDLFVGVELLL